MARYQSTITPRPALCAASMNARASSGVPKRLVGANQPVV